MQGGGSISPETVVTGDDGLAAAQRVLGPTAGQQTAQASADGLAGSPVTFVQTALASTPPRWSRSRATDQTAPAGFEVAEDLVVQLTDADGNGVGGRSVTWVVASGGGTANPVNTTTDPNGFARTRWTLGTVGRRQQPERRVLRPSTHSVLRHRFGRRAEQARARSSGNGQSGVGRSAARESARR